MATTLYEIPLNSYPESFSIEIQGQPFFLRTHWNEPMQRWVLDIGRSTEEWILTNIAMVAGVNLLEPFEHVGLGFGLVLASDEIPQDEATFDTLGTSTHLIVVTE
nr:MAG TPA: hypothetical protein [Caudoviricetes sp.]